jgi:hypothetical protein
MKSEARRKPQRIRLSHQVLVMFTVRVVCKK